MICETCSPPVTDPTLFWVAGLIALVVILASALIAIHHHHTHKKTVARLDEHMDQVKSLVQRK